MAKRKRQYRRTVTKYVRGRASKKGLMTMFKPVLAGVATGAIQSFVPDDALFGFGDSLVPVGVGYFMNDKTLMTLGGYQLGIKLAGSLGQGGSPAQTGGGY